MVLLEFGVRVRLDSPRDRQGNRNPNACPPAHPASAGSAAPAALPPSTGTSPAHRCPTAARTSAAIPAHAESAEEPASRCPASAGTPSSNPEFRYRPCPSCSRHSRMRFTRATWFKSEVCMRKIAECCIQLRRKIVALRLAFATNQSRLLFTLMKVMHDRTGVVEELAVDRPAMIFLPDRLAHHPGPFGLNRFFQREPVCLLRQRSSILHPACGCRSSPE